MSGNFVPFHGCLGHCPFRMLPLPCLLSDQGVDIIGLIEWTDVARPVLRLRAASRLLRQCVAPHIDLQDWGVRFTTHCAEMRGIEQAYEEYEDHRLEAGFCYSD